MVVDGEVHRQLDMFFVEQLQRVRRGSAVGLETERVMRWFQREWVERGLENAVALEDLGSEDDKDEHEDQVEAHVRVGQVRVLRPEMGGCEQMERMKREVERGIEEANQVDEEIDGMGMRKMRNEESVDGVIQREDREAGRLCYCCIVGAVSLERRSAVRS